MTAEDRTSKRLIKIRQLLKKINLLNKESVTEMNNVSWDDENFIEKKKIIASLTYKLEAAESYTHYATEIFTPNLVKIAYTNYKNIKSVRNIIPHSIRFGNNQWHTTDQWLLLAYDVDKNEDREFSCKDISGWNAY